MPILQTYYNFKQYFQIVDQHTGDKWLIHDTKLGKDNQLQRLELHCRISFNMGVNMAERNSKVTCPIQY